MNYNKKRMIVALHLTVSSVMLLSGFTSPGTKMNTAGDLRYAGGEIAAQIGDSVADGTISMIKGTKQVFAKRSNGRRRMENRGCPY